MKRLALALALLWPLAAQAQTALDSGQPLTLGGTVTGNLYIQDYVSPTRVCPNPGDANVVRALVCIQVTGSSNTGGVSAGLVINFTSIANSNVTEAYALFPVTTTQAGSPPVWALPVQCNAGPLSSGCKSVENDIANTDCDPGPLSALRAGCNKLFVDTLLGGFPLSTATQATITAKIDNGSGGAGNILTVSSVSSGAVQPGNVIGTGAGVAASTQIQAYGSHGTTGAGGTGTYYLSGNTQNVSSESMTTISGSFKHSAQLWVSTGSAYDGIFFSGSGNANHDIYLHDTVPLAIEADGSVTNVLKLTGASCSGSCILMGTNHGIGFDGVGLDQIYFDGTNFQVSGAGAVFSGVIQPKGSGNWTANGAVATAMSSLGPTGSHATIQEWFTVVDSGGTTRYIPAF